MARKRKNPKMSTWLILGGAGAAGYFLWLKPKIDTQQAMAAAAQQKPPGKVESVLNLLGAYWAAQQQAQDTVARYYWKTVNGQRMCVDRKTGLPTPLTDNCK